MPEACPLCTGAPGCACLCPRCGWPRRALAEELWRCAVCDILDPLHTGRPLAVRLPDAADRVARLGAAMGDLAPLIARLGETGPEALHEVLAALHAGRGDAYNLREALRTLAPGPKLDEDPPAPWSEAQVAAAVDDPVLRVSLRRHIAEGRGTRTVAAGIFAMWWPARAFRLWHGVDGPAPEREVAEALCEGLVSVGHGRRLPAPGIAPAEVSLEGCFEAPREDPDGLLIAPGVPYDPTSADHRAWLAERRALLGRLREALAVALPELFDLGGRAEEVRAWLRAVVIVVARLSGGVAGHCRVRLVRNPVFLHWIQQWWRRALSDTVHELLHGASNLCATPIEPADRPTIERRSSWEEGATTVYTLELLAHPALAELLEADAAQPVESYDALCAMWRVAQGLLYAEQGAEGLATARQCYLSKDLRPLEAAFRRLAGPPPPAAWSWCEELGRLPDRAERPALLRRLLGLLRAAQDRRAALFGLLEAARGPYATEGLREELLTEARALAAGAQAALEEAGERRELAEVLAALHER